MNKIKKGLNPSTAAHIVKEEQCSAINPLHRITVVGDDDPWDDYNPEFEENLAQVRGTNLLPKKNLETKTNDLELPSKKTTKKGPSLNFNVSNNIVNKNSQKENLDPEEKILKIESNQAVLNKEIPIDKQNKQKTPGNTNFKPRGFDSAYRELKKDLLNKQNKSNEEVTAIDLLLNPIEFVPVQNNNILSAKSQTKREDFFMKEENNDESKKNLVKNQPAQKSVKAEVKTQNVRNSAKAIMKASKQENNPGLISEELRECTFTPKTNNRPNSRRKFDEFLENQQKFQQNVEEKKKRLKYETEQVIEEERTFQPEICKNSKKIAEKKVNSSNVDNVSVHERLYEKGKKDESQLISQFGGSVYREEPSTFTPLIGEKSKLLVREDKVENLLYKDAQRRKEKFEKNVMEKNTQKAPQKKKYVSNKSEKIVVQKFMKEFDTVVEQLTEKSNTRVFLDYINMTEVLKRLGFLNCSENSENVAFTQERTLLHEIWKILNPSERKKGILKRNLCVFLLAVIGLYWSVPATEEGEDEEDGDDDEDEQKKDYSLKKSDPKSTGTFDEHGDWEVTEEEAREIHKNFDSFYRNRLYNEELKKNKHNWDYSFQPDISETSKALAAHYRERLLEETAALIENNSLDVNIPSNGKITHTDLLVIQKKIQKAQHEKLKNKFEKEVMEICTFRPKTNPNTARVQLSLEESAKESIKKEKESTAAGRKTNRGLELYNMAKPNNMKKDRDPKEIEYEKNCDECTFAPDLKNTKQKGSALNKEFMAKNVDKTIERMRNARIEREYVNKWRERGMPPNKDEFQKKKQSNNWSYQIKNDTIKGENEREETQRKTNPQETSEKFEINNDNQNKQNEIDDRVMENAPEIHSDKEEEEEYERIPLLFVDVNLGPDRTERIIVYEEDKSEVLAEKFATLHNLDAVMKNKLKEMLDFQIEGVLARIDEEQNNSEEEYSDNYEEEKPASNQLQEMQRDDDDD